MPAPPLKLSRVLPVEESAFVGGAERLATVRGWLEAGERLMTFTGPGGIGKTRLASMLLRSTSLAGVFVDLTEARDVGGALRGLTDELELADQRDPDVERIGQALAARGPLLLVLDNCEHLIGQLRGPVTRWQALAEATHFCLTSRRRLGVPHERVYEVPPLSCRETSQAPMGSEAVRLLLDRAVRQQADFTVATEEAGQIVAICAHLDGIPLAIELAAARLTTLGPRGLLERLQDGLSGSNSTAKVALEATLARTVRTSWELLDSEEQRWLARCSVFRGGFTVPAAEALATESDDTPVVDILQRLRDHSMLFVRPAPHLGLSPRFNYYGVVREWAAEQLGSDTAAVHDRHAAWFIEKAEALHEASRRRGGLQAQRRIAVERENIGLAVDRAIDAGRHRLAVRGIVAMQEHVPAIWTAKGYIARIDSALEVCGSSRHEAARGRLLEARGRALLWSGELDRAMRDLDEGIDLPSVRSDPTLHARLARARGVVHVWAGRLESAEADLTQALEWLQGSEDQELVALAHATLASVLIARGRPEEGALECRRALAICATTGDEVQEGWIRLGLANCLFSEGRIPEARREYMTNLEIERARGRRLWQGCAEGGLGRLALVEGEFGEAEARFAEAIEAFRQVGSEVHLAPYLGYRGVLELERQELERAERTLRRASRECERLNDEQHTLLIRAWLAVIDARNGHPEEAEQALEVAGSQAANTEHAYLSTVVSVQRAHVDLALAKASLQRRDDTETARHVESARSRIHAAEVSGERDSDVWIALACARRAMAEFSSQFPFLQDDMLLVHRDGDWFQVPGALAIACHRRKTVRSLLVRLATQRLERPGEAIGAERLIEHLWPGERVSPKSARNRLHVTVSTLRKLGLSAIVRTDEGYALDPELPVRLVHRPIPKSD